MISKDSRMFASLSVDLDNRWSYMKTHGDAGWQGFPSYLDIAVPRVLGVLGEKDLTVTFMIVGQDAALEKNADALRAIGDSPHELGNHSFHHEQWMHLRSEEELDAELALAEEHIAGATGRHPEGYRGPGYVLSPAVLTALKRRGYLYDASTFPTYLGPLARTYYFMTGGLNAEERKQRKDLFGSFTDGRQPITPYRWILGDERLLEIPVTTMPLLRVPIHVSYVLYLSVLSPALGIAYFSMALRLCRLAAIEPSILLHPLDFLGNEDEPELAFFPAMSLPTDRKLSVVGRLLDVLRTQYRVLPLGAHARELLARGNLEERPAI